MEPKARSRSRGRRYPADPPRVEEIIAVMRQAGETATGVRIRGLVVVLWRAGLRISEALALNEADLEPGHGALSVRRGKGGRAPRGRDGRLGLGSASALDRPADRLSGRTAFLRGSRHRTPERRGRQAECASSCVVWRSERECADASLPISCATHMRSRWHARAFRST